MSSLAALRGRPELADIFRAHGDRLPALRSHQSRVVKAITSCRTAALGGHVWECGHCGRHEISYNSCRDRHCPKCQGLDRLHSTGRRRSPRISCPFPTSTSSSRCPASCMTTSRAMPRIAYGLLFHAVADTSDSRQEPQAPWSEHRVHGHPHTRTQSTRRTGCTSSRRVTGLRPRRARVQHLSPRRTPSRCHPPAPGLTGRARSTHLPPQSSQLPFPDTSTTSPERTAQESGEQPSEPKIGRARAPVPPLGNRLTTRTRGL